ncbi:MAG: methylated-DNA--[Thermoguttaceae bacterium]|nr:methylated-DNA--[protein]-cysteine S-methyltransferase [Thermoguttaceae bacterium]
VQNIVAQQISSKAFETVWARFLETFGVPTPERVVGAKLEEINALGVSLRKAEYIKDFAQKIVDGSFDLDAIKEMSDEDAVAALTSLKGVGVWSAEMLLLFSLQRPDALSFGDFGIRRGMRMVYRKREIDKKFFETVRRRISPFGSVASLYFWAVAGGAIPALSDPADASKRARTNESNATKRSLPCSCAEKILKSNPLRIERYDSPIGAVLLAADDDALVGLWFDDRKRLPEQLAPIAARTNSPILDRVKTQLDAYFDGKLTNFDAPVRLIGTEFQTQVWRLLTEIPYGTTTSYGQLAAAIAERRGLAHMSSRAIGAAVGRNPISIVVPCHRVVGATGALVGYSGGLDKKEKLLLLERRARRN